MFLPKRVTNKATGWDVRAAFEDRKSITISFAQYIKIPLGFRAFVPNNWWYELKPRSSSFAKKNLHSLYGTIDEDFENQLVFSCQFIPSFNGRMSNLIPFGVEEKSYIPILNLRFEREILKIDFGEAVGQLIPVKRQEMIIESIDNTEYNQLCKERNGDRGMKWFWFKWLKILVNPPSNPVTPTYL